MDKIKIAYIILAHKNPEQLKRLVYRLHGGSTSFWIHIDKRVNIRSFYESMSDLSSEISIHFVKRESSVWGSFGMVQAIINGLDQIVEIDPTIDYVILLSLQDYPIKKLTTIEQFLEAYNGLSFMDYGPIPNTSWKDGGMDRILRYHFILLNHHLVVPLRRGETSILFRMMNSFMGLICPMPRKFPTGLTPFGGSLWWCLHRSAISYVLKFIEERPDVSRFFRKVWLPDEFFFQTILMNSPLASLVVNDNLRYIDWSRPCPPYPAILTRDDMGKLANSKELFARKFDPNVDEFILDLIDRKIVDRDGSTSS